MIEQNAPRPALVLPPRTREDACAFAAVWADAWSRKDVEAVLAFFDDAVVFESPRARAVTGHARVDGKAALGAYWRRAIAPIASMRFDVDEVTFDARAGRVVVGYRARFDAALLAATEHFTFGDDGRVVRGAAYHGDASGEERRAPPPPVAELQALPRTFEGAVTAERIDAMGHMNVAHYVALFDRATWAMMGRAGLDEDSLGRGGDGAFAVEQGLRYLGELREGDRLAIHTRVLAVRGKTLRFMHYMIDLGRGRVAATAELLAVYVDGKTRKAADFPPALAEALLSGSGRR